MKLFVFFLVVFASNQFARCNSVDPPRTSGCEITEAALAELAELRRIVGQLAALVETLVGQQVEPDDVRCPENDEMVPPSKVCDTFWDCPETGYDESDCPVLGEGVFPLTTPNYPDQYPDNARTVETGTRMEGLILTVEFHEFDLEEGDVLSIGCGFDPKDPSSFDVATLTGSEIPETVVIEDCLTVYVQFESDGMASGNGYNATLRIINRTAPMEPEPLPCDYEGEPIPHQGERRVDECTLCTCDNGTLSCPLDCPDVPTNVNELPCVYEGKPLNHLEELRPGDCMLCVCNNGTVSCDDEPGCTMEGEMESQNDVVTDVELVYTWREASVLWTPPVEDVVGYSVKLTPVEGGMGEITERLSPLETSWMTSEVVPGVEYTIEILPIMSDGPGTKYTTDPFTPACPEICPLIYNPVCATDGETYSSNCTLDKAQCETQDETLMVDYLGPCDPCLAVVCDVPVCFPGYVVAEEPAIGECCAGCVDPCEGIICDVPVCGDGMVAAEEPLPGECCVGCVDPCEGIMCDVPVCEEGLVVAQVPAPGECCPGCVHPCELIACEEPMCVDDYVERPPAEGECCAGCTRTVFEDCSDAAAAGMTTNKAYLIQPVGVAEPFEAQCDFEFAGGRWTVILRRIESPENFFREYDEYVAGFGDANDAYFIGLENLYRLNKQGNTRMAIKGIDHLGEEATGTYNNFRLSNATDNYMLTTIVGFKGTIGNALGYNKGAPFSAPGRDMDNGPRDCATDLGGGWWHKGKICTRANPLGEYITPEEFALEKGIFWAPFRGKGKSLQYLELKVRTV